MSGFLAAALSLPTVIFTVPLVVVVGYWLVVLLGMVDSDTDPAGEGGLSWLGLGGVPATVTLSLLVAFAWFASLAGAEVGRRLHLPAVAALALGGALVAAWSVTRVLVLVLRRVLPAGAEPSRADFVGRIGVVRTLRVTRHFGQAEVAAADGSTAVVQIRQTGADDLRAGQRAVLYDFDVDGEFFWVVPADVVHRPDPSTSRQKDR